MRLVIAATLGVLAPSLLTGTAAAQTPAELLQSCKAVIDAAGATQDPTVDIPVAGLTCWYYMAAVQNLTVIVDEHGRHLLGICAPQDTTLLQYVRIFTRYAEDHPQEPTDNPAALALRALLEAFPCGSRQPT
jgi:Rap1a immunity proteins